MLKESNETECHTTIVTRLRAQVAKLKHDKKRLEVKLAIAEGKAISYADFVNYSDHHIF